MKLNDPPVQMSITILLIRNQKLWETLVSMLRTLIQSIFDWWSLLIRITAYLQIIECPVTCTPVHVTPPLRDASEGCYFKRGSFGVISARISPKD